MSGFGEKDNDHLVDIQVVAKSFFSFPSFLLQQHIKVNEKEIYH